MFQAILFVTLALHIFDVTAVADADGDNPTCSANDKNCGRGVEVDLRSRSFWRSVAGAAGVNLHISEGASVTPSRLLDLEKRNMTAMREDMLKDGWTVMKDWDQGGQVRPLMKEFVKAIEEINDVRKLPATFLMVFDEIWDVAHAITSYLEPIYGLKLSHDFFIFNAKPGYEGWEVHRDGTGHDNILSFQKEDPYIDQPTYTTTWLALTDSDQETSCMHFIPASADEDYAILDHPTGVDDDFDFDDDVEGILVDSHRHLQAAPVKSGEALVWSHRTLHWSSASPPNAPYARLSVAFSMSQYHLDPPAIKYTDVTSIPPFEARVALVCYTGVSYHYNFHTPLKNKVLHLLLDVLSDHEYAQHLTDTAISPEHERQLADQFSFFLQRIYKDRELDGIQGHVVKVAKYIVIERGLESTRFLRYLAGVESDGGNDEEGSETEES